METYLKLWRHFPRFTVGFVFLIALTAAMTGMSTLVELVKNLATVELQEVSGLLTSVLSLTALLLLSSLGLSVLNIAVDIFGFVFSIFLRPQRVHQLLVKAGIGPLIMSIPELARAYFLENESDIIEYYYLKSWAQPEVLGKVKALKTHTKRMADHIKRIQDLELLQHLDYYSSVTQEQVLRDHLRGDIDEIYHLLIVGALLVFSFVRSKLSISIVVPAFLGYVAFAALMVPILCKRRRRLACYITIGYLDAFTLGEGSTMADRDAV